MTVGTEGCCSHAVVLRKINSTLIGIAVEHYNNTFVTCTAYISISLYTKMFDSNILLNASSSTENIFSNIEQNERTIYK